jgi:hypothetical protein
VLAIAADCLATFLAGAARFFGIEFVRRAFLMRSLTAFAGNFALLIFIHCSKAPFGRAAIAAAALLRVAARAAALATTIFACRHVDLLV